MNQAAEAVEKLEYVKCNLCGSGDADEAGVFHGIKIVRCRGCGLLYRNPRLKEEASRRFYSVDYYNRYGGMAEGISAARMEFFGRALALLGRKRSGGPGRLLDIGCGQGHFLKLAKDSGWDVAGIEPSRSACEYAKEKFGIEPINGRFEDMSFDEGRFDVVTMWNVLDHTLDPLAVLLKANRLLGPGGALVIRVPNVAFHLFAHVFFKLIRRLIKGKRLQDPSVVTNYGFSGDSLTRFLKKAHFSGIGIYNSPPSLGDPYDSFGILEGSVVHIAKRIYYLFSQAVFFLSFKRVTTGTALFVFARK